MHFRDVGVAARGVHQRVPPQGHSVDRLGGGTKEVLQEGAGASIGICGEEKLSTVVGAASTHTFEIVPALGHIGRHLNIERLVTDRWWGRKDQTQTLISSS